MSYNPNLILYACVSKGTTVLAEHSSGDKEAEDLALQCLEKIPSLHAIFSQTIGKRSHTFLMEDPFVYFAIYEENLDKQQGLDFLKSLKEAFLSFFAETEPLKNLDDLTSHYFHDKFIPIFEDLLDSPGDANILPPPPPPDLVYRDHRRNVSIDSNSGKMVVAVPLLEKPDGRQSKKKKNKKKDSDEMDICSRDIPIEKMGFVPEDDNHFSLPLQKNGFFGGNSLRQQAQKKWWGYVGIALVLDLLVCAGLFLVWFWICSGFKCLKE